MSDRDWFLIPSASISSSLLSSTPDRAEEQDWTREFVSEPGLLSPGLLVWALVVVVVVFTLESRALDWLDLRVATMLSLGGESMEEFLNRPAEVVEL